MNTQTKEYQARKNRLLPDGKPRWIRCYDAGEDFVDRYTVVFTGRYRFQRMIGGSHLYLAMNAYPFDPQGFGQHGESEDLIDWPTYGHLGKKITFDDLPEDCQKFVMQNYVYLWDIKDHPLYFEM